MWRTLNSGIDFNILVPKDFELQSLLKAYKQKHEQEKL